MTGSGKSMNFPFVKQIRLNEEQMNKFDPKEIRKLIDGNHANCAQNRRIVNVLREMFEKGVLKVYADKLTEQYKKVLEDL